ncbi:MAG: DUF3754 domain-containing protein [Kiritimatiellia bacterium]|nr:DUF3754 domain-containing protein [Kiritimatiellia bacterium]
MASESSSHFIPYSKDNIIKMCLAEGALSEGDRDSFSQFATILSALLHHEYHDRQEILKSTFAPLNPDEALISLSAHSQQERNAAEDKFLAMFREVLTGANFKEMSREEIARSISENPRLGIRVEVDLDQFERVCVFRRDVRTEHVVEKKLFGFKKEEYDRKFYDRVVLYLRFKDLPDDQKHSREELGDAESGQSYLKLFAMAPTDGLEMLFPNAKMKMTLKDKFLIGGPAAAGGIFMLIKKLLYPLATLSFLIMFWLGLREEEVEMDGQKLAALAVAVAAVAGFVFKQLKTVRLKRTKYMQALLQNLYFRVLDNNNGVLHHLTGEAEDEDGKEALLAYYFLLTRDNEMTEQELDNEVENWFKTNHNATFDFEVNDAARKLERMGLAERRGDKLTVTSLAESKKHIDVLWDNVFSYNNGGKA